MEPRTRVSAWAPSERATVAEAFVAPLQPRSVDGGTLVSRLSRSVGEGGGRGVDPQELLRRTFPGVRFPPGFAARFGLEQLSDLTLLPAASPARLEAAGMSPLCAREFLRRFKADVPDAAKAHLDRSRSVPRGICHYDDDEAETSHEASRSPSTFVDEDPGGGRLSLGSFGRPAHAEPGLSAPGPMGWHRSEDDFDAPRVSEAVEPMTSEEAAAGAHDEGGEEPLHPVLHRFLARLSPAPRAFTPASAVEELLLVVDGLDEAVRLDFSEAGSDADGDMELDSGEAWAADVGSDDEVHYLEPAAARRLDHDAAGLIADADAADAWRSDARLRVEGLHAAARLGRPVFESLVREAASTVEALDFAAAWDPYLVAAECDLASHRAAVASHPSASPGPALARLYDMVRGAVVCASFAQIRALAQRVADTVEASGGALVRARNRFLHPRGPQRDLLLALRLRVPDGLGGAFYHIAELRLQHRRLAGPHAGSLACLYDALAADFPHVRVARLGPSSRYCVAAMLGGARVDLSIGDGPDTLADAVHELCAPSGASYHALAAVFEHVLEDLGEARLAYGVAERMRQIAAENPALVAGALDAMVHANEALLASREATGPLPGHGSRSTRGRIGGRHEQARAASGRTWTSHASDERPRSAMGHGETTGQVGMEAELPPAEGAGAPAHLLPSGPEPLPAAHVVSPEAYAGVQLVAFLAQEGFGRRRSSSQQGRPLPAALSPVAWGRRETRRAVRGPFEGASVPGISIADYVQRITAHSGMTAEAVVVASVLLQRLSEAVFVSQARAMGAVTVQPPPQRLAGLTPLTIHRAVLIALLLGHKLHDDRALSNRCWAYLGGVTPQEVNALEMSFLLLVGYDRLVVQPLAYEATRRLLESAGLRAVNSRKRKYERARL